MKHFPQESWTPSGHGKASELLFRGILKTPKTVYAFSTLLGCFPETERKILVLEIPHTLDIRCGETELKVTWKRFPRGPALIVPKGAILPSRGEKQSIVQPSCKAYES